MIRSESRKHRSDNRPPGTSFPASLAHAIKPSWSTWATLVGLSILVLAIGGRDLTQGGFAWSDAPLHAMDGVFLHDLLAERPAGSWRTWAQSYYLKYPCLGFVVYYPPLFAMIEAIVFGVVGISVAAAHATVLLFVIGAVWLIYLLARELFSSRVAAAAAAILALATPAGVAWSRQVMLEWPAVFFIALALLAWCRYRLRPGWAAGTLIGIGCLGAYLTRQTSLFVLIVVFAHVWLRRQWHVTGRRSFLVPVLIAVVLIGGYAGATAGMNKLAPQLILGSPPLKHLLDPTTWTWYLLRLPAIIGWPVTIAFAVSVVTLIATRHNQQRGRQCDQQDLYLPVLWLVAWWLICTVFAANEERYFFYAVPAVALLAAAGLARLDGNRRFGVGTALLAILCCVQIVGAIMTPARRLPTMQPTVDYLVQQADADLVLIDAVRDGQFVFDVRTTDAARDRIIPMRASKFLYSRSARTRYNYQAHINTPQELLAWLDQYGIRYVVIENQLPKTQDTSWDTPPRIMLRDTLESARGLAHFREAKQVPDPLSERGFKPERVLNDTSLFQPVFTQSLAGNDPAWKDVQLIAYRYLNAKPRQSNTITVHIPAMGQEIKMKLPK